MTEMVTGKRLDPCIISRKIQRELSIRAVMRNVAMDWMCECVCWWWGGYDGWSGNPRAR